MRTWLTRFVLALAILMAPGWAAAGQAGYCPKPTSPWCSQAGYARYGACVQAWDQGAFCLGAARTQTFRQTIRRDEDGLRLQVRTPQNEMQPTGYHVAPGAMLRIKVTRKADEGLPVLVVGTPHRDTLRPSRTLYRLAEGDNVVNARIDGVDVAGNPFVDEWGGTAYILYTSATPSSVADIEFSEGFRRVPYFVKDRTTRAQYLEMLELFDDVDDVMLVSDRAMVTMTLARARALSGYDQQAMLEIYDHIIAEEGAISGLDGSAPIHAGRGNRLLVSERLVPSNPSSWIGAITFPTSLIHRAVNPLEIGAGGGWGLWHEFGHTHQQTWTWGAVVEATVNIYSMAVERSLGLPSRLVRDNSWPSVDTYLARPDAQRNYNDNAVASNYVRLAMFHQLWLAYGDGFYRELHRRTRQERPSLPNDAARMRYFALRASEISGHDLSGFLRKWGLPLDAATYAELAALGLPAPATDLSQLRDP